MSGTKVHAFDPYDTKPKWWVYQGAGGWWSSAPDEATKDIGDQRFDTFEQALRHACTQADAWAWRKQLAAAAFESSFHLGVGE